MSEPKIDSNWNSNRQHFRIRSFLVAGTSLLLLCVALILSTVKGCMPLGQHGRLDFFAPSEADGVGFVGKTNELLAILLADVDTTVTADNIDQLNRRYPALEFALPYGEDHKPVIEAADLRLVGIHPERIKDEKWRNFYYNSRLPQLLRQQREETGETYFDIRAKGVKDKKGRRHIEISSIRLYASMFKVALVKNPWKGEIHGRQNCLFCDTSAIFLTYGGSMVPVPVQPDHNVIGGAKQTISAVMDTCMLLDAHGHPLDYYQIYKNAFDRTNADRERAVSINMCETRGGKPQVNFVLSCARKGKAKELKIISGADVLVFGSAGKVDTIKASKRGAEKAEKPIAVIDGMKLAVYGNSGRKLGEFVVNTKDPTRVLSSIIQSNTGQMRYNIPACQTDLFTQQVIRGVSRHLSADDHVASVDLSIDPMLSLELENAITGFVHSLPGKLPAGKPATQKNEQYDMSVTVMDIATGEVLATPFYTTKFDPVDYPQQLKMTTRNVALSRRFVGSTFKPFVALAAVQANPGLLDLNTSGKVHLNPKTNEAKRVDPKRTADFFGYTIKNPWAQLAPSHWDGCDFVSFLQHSDDVYPAALAAIAMGGGKSADAIAVKGENSFFQKKADGDLYLRDEVSPDTKSYPFLAWMAHITCANHDDDTDYYDRNPLRGIQNKEADYDVRTYGLREITPDVTNLHFELFRQGGRFRSEVVPWVLGQGSNEWSAVTMAQAWARMIGRHDVIATYTDTKDNKVSSLTDVEDYNIFPGCNTQGGSIRAASQINATWNTFLDKLSAAASGGTLGPMKEAVGTLNNSLGGRGGDPLVLYCKTGTPDAYSRYDVVRLGGSNRFFDIGMFSFALMPQSAVNRVKNGGTGNGIVCIVRVTRTYQCNRCGQEHQCKACSEYNGLQSSTARDFFAANPSRMRMLYDMTSRYYRK